MTVLSTDTPLVRLAAQLRSPLRPTAGAPQENSQQRWRTWLGTIAHANEHNDRPALIDAFSNILVELPHLSPHAQVSNADLAWLKQVLSAADADRQPLIRSLLAEVHADAAPNPLAKAAAAKKMRKHRAALRTHAGLRHYFEHSGSHIPPFS